MLKIRSIDKVAQSLISELVALLTNSGAVFHPKLQLEIRASEFSFSTRKNIKADEELVILPLCCMPLLEDFKWSLDDDYNLCWEPMESPVAKNIELHKQLVDLLVQLYNHFGKLEAYASTSPVVKFAGNRPLAECLLEYAQEYPFKEKLNEGLDQLKIHAFWHSRIFSDYLTGRLHLIPVMEFFDHSIFASNFYWDDLPDGSRALHHALHSNGGNKGLFARYEIMDNLHAFVKYSFVDEKSFFVQSQPFSILLGEVVLLEIGYQSASSNQCRVSEWQTTPSFSNSLMYRARLKFQADRVFMPYLLVPPVRHIPAFDEALGAQLQEIEQYTGAEFGGLANPEMLRQVKIKLLEENEKVYSSIAQMAREAKLKSQEPATQLLKKMLNHQKKILKEFRKTLE